ncbi:MAG: response regulator [Alphaproteobacteria bacterium]|nr:response regulator [Alphaproteobacteria bacterium]
MQYPTKPDSPRPIADPPLRLLVAEDNPVNQMLAVALLTRMGHRVDVADNGKEAVDAVRSLSYDLVLMDVQMPEMDGFEATARIRGLAPPKSLIPIIALTATTLAGEDGRCRARGMDDYLAKPIDVAQLAEALRRWGRGPAGRDTVPTACPVRPARERTPGRGLLYRPTIDDLVLEVGAKRAATLIQIYCAELQTTVRQMTNMAAQGDHRGVAERAHSLKGTSGSFGAAGLQDLAEEIEFAAREDNGQRVRTRIAEITQQAEDVLAALEAVRRELVAEDDSPRATIG